MLYSSQFTLFYRPLFKLRSGFTLVELLVVIGILAVLAAILLPAVQSARESGRQTQCKNNLRQYALGTQLYHDALKALPRAGDIHGPLPTYCCSSDVRDYWNWTYHILPYMEFIHVYELKRDEDVYSSLIPLQYCPTRRLPALYDDGRTTRIDYAGNGGSGFDDWSFPVNDGVILKSSLPLISFVAITDGLSNTLLYGEKQLHLTYIGDNYLENIYDDNEKMFNCGFDTDVIKHGGESPKHDSQHPPRSTSYIFGSRHVGFMNAAFADSSIRSVSYNIESNIFRKLCNRSDGEAINVP